MADRKRRSVTFRTPEQIGLGDLKAAVQQKIQDTIAVFQDLGDDVFFWNWSRKAIPKFWSTMDLM